MRLKNKIWILIAILAIVLLAVFCFSLYKFTASYSATANLLAGSSFFVKAPIDTNKIRFTLPLTIEGKSLDLIVDNQASSILPERFIRENGGVYLNRSVIPTFNAYGDFSFKKLYGFSNVYIDTLELPQAVFFLQKRIVLLVPKWVKASLG